MRGLWPCARWSSLPNTVCHKHTRVTILNEYGDILAISEAATVEVKEGE